MKAFHELLSASAAAHGHLCAGQVVGVRMAMLGCRLIDLDDPTRSDQIKKLIVYVEMDRCTADAVAHVPPAPIPSAPSARACDGSSRRHRCNHPFSHRRRRTGLGPLRREHQHVSAMPFLLGRMPLRRSDGSPAQRDWNTIALVGIICALPGRMLGDVGVRCKPRMTRWSVVSPLVLCRTYDPAGLMKTLTGSDSSGFKTLSVCNRI